MKCSFGDDLLSKIPAEDMMLCRRKNIIRAPRDPDWQDEHVQCGRANRQWESEVEKIRQMYERQMSIISLTSKTPSALMGFGSLERW